MSLACTAELEAGALRALLSVSLEARVAHRQFAPLYADEAFARLFGFESAAAVMQAPRLAPLLAEGADPELAWGAFLCARAQEGEGWMTRRDGARFYARFKSRLALWNGESAAVMAIAPATAAAAEDRREALAFSPSSELLSELLALLERLGWRGRGATSVVEAAALAAERRYDLVIVDLAGDAIMLARAIRALPVPFGSAPMAALCERVAPAPAAAIEAAGMDGFLLKPATEAALARLIRLIARPSLGDETQSDSAGK